MIPAEFEYVRPTSLDDALAKLTEYGDDAKLLAGGHSLLPLMKLRLAMPEVLVDVGALRELSYVRADGDDVAIGAGTRHYELERDTTARAEVPMLAHAASLVGDPQVRHRGTLGGTVAHGDPASDVPTALYALDATAVVRSPRGERSVPIAELCTGFLETSLEPDEMVVEVRVPRTGQTAWGYEKFTRRANDWPIVAVAAVAGRVALANMAHTVVRAGGVERALADGASATEAADAAADGTNPPEDMHADKEYRSHLARVLTKRALQAAAG